MQITWLGHACFLLQGRGTDGDVKVLIDPFDEKVGKLPRNLSADLVLQTHDHHDHSAVDKVEGASLVIKDLGEYEHRGIIVYGIQAWHDATEGKERGATAMYVINMEGMNIAHLGDIGQKELTEKQLDQLGRVDILLVPVGGVYTVDAAGAMSLINQIEPRIVIPMHFGGVPGLEVKLDPLEKFLKAWGGKKPEAVDKWKVVKKDLPQEDMQLVLFQNP